MNKFIGLILAGLLGYIAYPFMPPKLFGVKEVASSEVEVKEEVKEVVVPEDKKLPEVVIPEVVKEEAQPIKMQPEIAKEEIIPEIEDPVVVPKIKELDEVDIKKIISTGVETGKYVDFRKNNIISWELKELSLSLQGSRYEGEITIELGTLFGPKLRRANVVISDEEISEWKWLEDDKKD